MIGLEEDNIFKSLYKYILGNISIIILFFAFVGIFMGIFSLYNLEIEAVIYASILCIVLALIYFIFKFLNYYKKHIELIRIEKNISLIANELPPPRRGIEEDYHNMIFSLIDINNKNLTELVKQRKESIDYYTTWVHQIKVPISVMKLILQGEDTNENKELLSELFKIEEYVEMVLCYFRLDSSSSDFVFKEYELDDIIKKSIRKYASQFIRKKISLNYKGTNKIILTDEKWLSFIIEQILSNAIKYTDKGVITISVDKDKILSISDTGIGIAEEDIHRIFEKGFTGYNGRADKKSTGLGLYLCKRAANKISHKIYVESEVGKGSTFFIDLKTIDLQVE
ncbi:MAG: sensor histidine kinase [Clostridium sp.]|uniref:sensor histidine kinase n=1 Tax=Clostridium sp. TaxID=1506 RepID=UPI0029076198|nr:sensor histidine kinase [Clostridium sp.]MDU5109706.1 sensor histidine kinase [Clostridium sp.]